MFVHSMPLIHFTIQPNHLRLAIWEFHNYELSPLEEFLANKHFSSSLEEVKLDKRKREIIGASLLKRCLGIPPITYESTGKPIAQSGHISISHSENMVGVIHADFTVGLDLQIPSEKLYRIRTKFCNERELLAASRSDDELLSLTVIWSAKEAVFKMFGKNVPFAAGIDVHILDEKTIVCKVTTDEIKATIELTYFWIHGQVVVYTACPQDLGNYSG